MSLNNCNEPMTVAFDERLLDLLPAAVYVCGADGVIQYFNQRAVELWGREPKCDDTDERFCGAFKLYYPDGRFMAHANTPMAEVLRDGRPQRNREAIIQRPNGSRITVMVNIDPLRDDRGRLVGAVNVFQDISDRKQSEFYRTLQLRIAEALAHAGTFREAASHILRATCECLGWDVGVLWTVDEKAGLLRCIDLWHTDEIQVPEFEAASRPRSFAPNSGLPGRIWASREPVWVRDVQEDREFPRCPVAAREGLRGAFGYPILLGQDVLGVIEFFSTEVREPADDLLEMMVSIGSQIGQFIDRKRAEEQLRRNERELADFFDNAAVGLHWVGPDGSILRANRAELDLLGYSREQYIGRPIADFHADQEAIADILRRLHAGEELHECEARLCCKDGSIKHVLIDSNVLWEDGRFVHTRCFTRDITEKKRTEQELQRAATEWEQTFDAWTDHVCILDTSGRILRANKTMREQFGPVHGNLIGLDYRLIYCGTATPDPQPPCAAVLSGSPPVVCESQIPTMEGWQLVSSYPLFDPDGRQWGVVSIVRDITERKRMEDELKAADRRKDEFLAMLAHELRNPLAPIRSGLDILAMSGQDTEPIRLMQQQVEHLVRLVDDLLDVSRIIRGRIELRREPIELAAVVTRTVETVRPFINAQQHELMISLPAEPVWLNADAVRLAQVITNLLNNSAKYTEPGGRIWLTAERSGEQVDVRVRDTGSGIDADLLPRIFDLFTQAEQTIDRSQGGLGIGLTLVKNLVEMHGGGISAHSEGVGKGSEFTIRLPILHKVAEKKADPQGPDSTASYRILVVDDNRAAAKMLSLLVSKLGSHAVQMAHDGSQALEIATVHQPEIVLLDIGLPRMDGYEVARRLRQQPEFQQMLLVALTGYGQEEDRRRSLEAGFDEHLVKPPSVDILRQLFIHPKLQDARPCPD